MSLRTLHNIQFLKKEPFDIIFQHLVVISRACSVTNEASIFEKMKGSSFPKNLGFIFGARVQQIHSESEKVTSEVAYS